MKAIKEISEVFAVSNTEFNATPAYQLEATNARYIVIKEISLSFDSNMQSNGKFLLRIAGSSVTSQGASSEQNVTSTGVINFNYDISPLFVHLEPGQSLDIDFKISTGSGDAQVFVSGYELNAEEFAKFKEKSGVF